MAAGLSGLSGEQLQEIVTAGAEKMGIGADWAVILEGSLAEGFGNERSDIDLVFIDDGERDYLTMPSVLFLHERRVEIRRRSGRQVRAQAEEVLRLGRKGPAGIRGISRDLLDRVQRFAGAVVLRPSAYLSELQACIGSEDLEAIVSSWYARSARDSAKAAVFFAAVGADDAAVPNARTAAVHATKAWLARQGETYIEPKWLHEQLARTPGGEVMATTFASVEGRLLASGGAAERIRNVIDFLPDSGVAPVGSDPGAITVHPVRGVTTWSIGGRVHVLKGKQDMYVLGDAAADAWRSLPFSASLPDAVDAMSESGVQPAYFLPELHRLGLVGLRWKGEGRFDASSPGGGCPSPVAPVVGLDGGRVPADGGDRLHMIPVSARRFVEAGMTVAWSNVIVENALEDARGALTRNQWGMFAIVIRRCVRYVCVVVLSAFGVAPWPPAEEAISVLTRLRLVPGDLTALARSLESVTDITTAEQAGETLRMVDHLVAALRLHTGTALFPGSFDGQAGWLDTLGLGNDWLRLSAYLGVTPPKEEVQDIVAGKRSAPSRVGPGSW